MNRRDSGHGVMIVAIVIIIVVVLGLLGWVFFQNLNKSTGSTITNFDQCKAATGSKMLETYPEQCVTSDGRSFTGPNKAGDTVAIKKYCAAAEKLCFSYRDDWKVTTQAQSADANDGATSDLVTVTSSDGDLALVLETGIGGIGGVCPDENTVSVKVLDPTPISAMTGYKSEFSLDILQVARVVYPADNKYVAAVYVTGAPEYSTAGVIKACGTGFSMFINGKNTRVSSDSNSAGAFRFGYTGTTGGARFSSEKDATDALESDTYKQAVTLLAGLHYQ